jgi:hypothetical protein
VGSEESLSIAEVAKRVAQGFFPHPHVEIQGKINLQKPIEQYIPSTSRANQELGLSIWVSLEDSILRTKEFNSSDLTF